ncbi:DUF4189 domain-containing protein [Nocardia sp. R7R-8]|uniref:DUF4189 domain-containing protein n=1 Tax=Nocardia sp. R7R-8 TaxID=3459304 RepID=UPI00403D6EAF
MAAILIPVGAGVASAEPGPDGRYYGSLGAEVVGDYIHAVWAVDYPSWEQADASVLQHCTTAKCRIHVRFVDGCGAIAYRSGALVGRAAATRAEAERSALDAFGPPVSSLSAAPKQAQILQVACTNNAG